MKVVAGRRGWKARRQRGAQPSHSGWCQNIGRQQGFDFETESVSKESKDLTSGIIKKTDVHDIKISARRIGFIRRHSLTLHDKLLAGKHNLSVTSGCDVDVRGLAGE